MRHYTIADKLLSELDQALRTIHGRPPTTERPNPARAVSNDSELTEGQAAVCGRLMRVNHAGEIAAQGLYQGQALMARRSDVQQRMRRSAMEENDHLAWCKERIEELGSRPSLLGPFWYWGSFAIGALTGAVGDKWSLGFVRETERQVVAHLEEHLRRLPEADASSRAVLEQMKADEARHGQLAEQAGAAELPLPVQRLMGLASKVMTKTAYWI